MPPANRPNQQTPKPSAIEDVWDEAQIEKALKRLDVLHVKSRLLRSTIPRMTHPLTTSRTPQTLFQLFVKSVGDANKEIQDFKDLMNDAESKKVLEHAKRSRRDNPLGITPWNPTEHPDWFKLDK